MKKNTISIDFIAFGDLEPENTKKLEAFNEHIKTTEGSHLAIIPPGPNLLSDHLMTTDILVGDGIGPRGGDSGADGGESGGGGFEFGVDPSLEPELALALRISMEEEKARQEKEGKAQGEASKEPTLEGIPEEGGESQPLLNENGEPSGRADVLMADDEGEKRAKKGEDEEDDKMDTA